MLLFAFQVSVNKMPCVNDHSDTLMKTPPLKRQPKIRVLNPDVPKDLELMIKKMVDQEERRKKEESSYKLSKIIRNYINLKIK